MSENHAEVRKIQTLGKALRIVMTILCILAFVCAGGMLIGALVFAVVPDSLLSMSLGLTGEVSVSSSLPFWEDLAAAIAEDVPGGAVTGNALTFSFGSGTPVELPLTKLCALALFIGMLYMAVYAVIFLFVAKFGKVLHKNSTPFSKPCIRYLKVTAFILLGWSVLSLVTGGEVRRILTGGLFGISLGGSLDLGSLFIALVLLLVAYIFEYGAKLQRESDETL